MKKIQVMSLAAIGVGAFLIGFGVAAFYLFYFGKFTVLVGGLELDVPFLQFVKDRNRLDYVIFCYVGGGAVVLTCGAILLTRRR